MHNEQTHPDFQASNTKTAKQYCCLSYTMGRINAFIFSAPRFIYRNFLHY